MIKFFHRIRQPLLTENKPAFGGKAAQLKYTRPGCSIKKKEIKLASNIL